MPALAKILPKYPDIKVEVVFDYGLTNIVAERYDAGIRPGELVVKDMIAVRIGPDLRMAVVGAPRLLRRSQKAANSLRILPPIIASTFVSLPMADFTPGNSRRTAASLNVRVDGQLVFSGAGALLSAALRGLGLAYLTDAQVQPYAGGRPSGSCPVGLVPAVLRLPFVLSEPAPGLAGVFAAGRRASLYRGRTEPA